MKNALIIMAYAGKNGNITISPRLSTGHSEPSYYPNATIEWLPGSGFVNGTMTANGRCRNCRVWPGGALQVNSSSGNMIFASGPAGTIGSDSLSAGVKAHSEYGVFEMDLRRASGVGGVPVLSNSSASTSVGATQEEIKTYYSAAGPAHGVCLISGMGNGVRVGVMLIWMSYSMYHGLRLLRLHAFERSHSAGFGFSQIPCLGSDYRNSHGDYWRGSGDLCRDDV